MNTLSPSNPVLLRKRCQQFNRAHPEGTSIIVMLGPGRSVQRTVKKPGAYVRGSVPVVQVGPAEFYSLQNVAGVSP